MTRRYEVDAAMMGRDMPDGADVTEFCRVLQELTPNDVEIIPITGAWNGARFNDQDLISDGVWDTAMEQYLQTLR